MRGAVGETGEVRAELYGPQVSLANVYRCLAQPSPAQSYQVMYNTVSERHALSGWCKAACTLRRELERAPIVHLTLSRCKGRRISSHHVETGNSPLHLTVLRSCV